MNIVDTLPLYDAARDCLRDAGHIQLCGQQRTGHAKEVMLEEQIKFSDDRSGDDGVFGEVRRNRPPVCSVCCQCVTSASCAIGCAKN